MQLQSQSNKNQPLNTCQEDINLINSHALSTLDRTRGCMPYQNLNNKKTTLKHYSENIKEGVYQNNRRKVKQQSYFPKHHNPI